MREEKKEKGKSTWTTSSQVGLVEGERRVEDQTGDEHDCLKAVRDGWVS